MNLKNFFKVTIAVMLMMQGSQSFANEKAAATIEDILPKLYAFAAPLSQKDFEFFLNPIISFLKSECKRNMPAQVKTDQQEACVLEESWNHLNALSQTLGNPDASPLQFSEGLNSSRVDQVAAGAWKRSGSRPPEGQSRVPTLFAADVMMTKVVVQKSLAAYARWSVFLSRDQDNSAKNYIVPKLIQSLEGRSLLGSLFERYQQHKCTVAQVMAKPGTNICQIEKSRLATIIYTLFKSNEADIAEVVRMTSLLVQEGNKSSAIQISFLEPMQKTMKEFTNDSESAFKMWKDLKSNGSTKRDQIQKLFQNLTAFPIALSNEELVNTYMSLSALMALKDIANVTTHLESQQVLATEIIPSILDNSDLKKLHTMSKRELSAMTHDVQYFINQSSDGDF